MHNGIRTVAVLLASYNGAEWIEEQLNTILQSHDVKVHVFLSDDGSTDDTVELARRVGGKDLTVLPSQPKGSAGQNFLRLVSDAPWDEFDYIAFSDQDDIWRQEKLSRAIRCIEERNLAGYSSDVTAFWPDGRRLYIKKSHPMRRWDHLFESAGPGSTFVLPNREARFLRDFLSAANADELKRVSLHDWLIYSLFRQSAKVWFIDGVSNLDYRQHRTNILGASSGLGSLRSRMKLVRKGWYRQQIIAVGTLIGASNPVLSYVRAPRLRSLWVPVFYAAQCRRRPSEAFLFALLLVSMAFVKP